MAMIRVLPTYNNERAALVDWGGFLTDPASDLTPKHLLWLAAQCLFWAVVIPIRKMWSDTCSSQ